jgi:hypothetical protein
MISQTHLPTIRQPATRIATGTLAALLLVAFAQPSSASDTDTRVGPEPHWSSRIGTGQPVLTGQARAAFMKDASASADWSARIGTGRVVVESRSAPVASSIGGAPPPTHWSARIGTGHISPGTDVEASLRTQVHHAKPLGEHPAVLVAQKWSSRAIDPNAFIVRHPAGPVWVTGYLTSRSGYVLSDPTSNPRP